MSVCEVKICGLTCREDVGIVNQVKPEYIGMVLYFDKSSRNLDIAKASELLLELDKAIKSVAVTVSPTYEQLVSISEAGFDYIQVHKTLGEDILRQELIPVIRAYNIGSDDDCISARRDIERIKDCSSIAAFLLDSSVSGSGRTIENDGCRELIDYIKATGKRVFLAGGLTQDNVSEAIRAYGPDVVDVSSGVEYTDRPKGQGKDERLVVGFVNNARNI